MKRMLALIACLALPLLAGTSVRAQTPTPNKPVAKPQTNNDSVNEMSEEQQLKLQMQMDRKKKAQETLSNQEKKNSDTDSAIIKNMK